MKSWGRLILFLSGFSLAENIQISSDIVHWDSLLKHVQEGWRTHLTVEIFMRRILCSRIALNLSCEVAPAPLKRAKSLTLDCSFLKWGRILTSLETVVTPFRAWNSKSSRSLLYTFSRIRGSGSFILSNLLRLHVNAFLKVKEVYGFRSFIPYALTRKSA